MHQKAMVVAVVLGLSAVACSAAPVEHETVGTEAAALRDPIQNVCWYVECDENGVPITPPSGGGGGIGGSGEGPPPGESGGGGGGGGPGGVGGAGAGSADANDLARCTMACAAGAPAIAQFCSSIPVPQVQALCFANQFAGEVACTGFCYAWFLAS